MLLMEALKSWLLIGRANLISTNGLSFTFWSQPLQDFDQILGYPNFKRQYGDKQVSVGLWTSVNILVVICQDSE